MYAQNKAHRLWRAGVLWEERLEGDVLQAHVADRAHVGLGGGLGGLGARCRGAGRQGEGARGGRWRRAACTTKLGVPDCVRGFGRNALCGGACNARCDDHSPPAPGSRCWGAPRRAAMPWRASCAGASSAARELVEAREVCISRPRMQTGALKYMRRRGRSQCAESGRRLRGAMRAATVSKVLFLGRDWPSVFAALMIESIGCGSRRRMSVPPVYLPLWAARSSSRWRGHSSDPQKSLATARPALCANQRHEGCWVSCAPRSNWTEKKARIRAPALPQRRVEHVVQRVIFDTYVLDA